MGQRSGARRPSCPVKRQLRRRTGRSLSSRNPAKRRARPRWRLLLRTQYLLHFSHFHTAERTPNIGSRPFNAADITTPAIKRTPDRGIAEQKEPKRHAYFRNCPPATFGSRIVRKSGATKRGRRGYIRHFRAVLAEPFAPICPGACWNQPRVREQGGIPRIYEAWLAGCLGTAWLAWLAGCPPGWLVAWLAPLPG